MNLLSNNIASVVSGGTGIAVIEAVPTNTTFDTVLKAVVAVVSVIPAIINLFKKKTKKTPVKDV